jgi:RNA polymerase sigma-70 factor, ECF subfamily
MDLEDQQRLRNGLKNGNKKIFEEIYKAYYSPLVFYCHRYVGDMEEAREIVQGLFFKIWLKRKDLKINCSIKSYLYTSVQNYALNHLQKKKIKQKYIIRKVNVPLQQNENGQNRLEEEELKVLIRSAILKLPNKRREIFELSRFENLKYSQIAEQMRISVKTVETQMSKSLSFLRKALSEYMPVLLIQLLWICSFYW